MKINRFKQFLLENEENLAKIKEILNDMDAEELDDFGTYLVDVFLDDLPEDEYDQDFTKDDILEMIEALGYDFYDEILDELQEIEADWDEDGKTSDTNEAVSRRMKTKDFNRKKRKFMQTSRSELRQTRAKRKQAARKSKTARKRYYKANKQKIAQYQKSRREAIKKGKHKVKQRRAT